MTYPPWLDQLHNIAADIQQLAHYPIHSAVLQFVPNLKRWFIEGENLSKLPYVFDPLFDKCTDIITRLALLTPIIPKSQRNAKDIALLRQEINLGLLMPEKGPSNLENILRAALLYGSLEVGRGVLPIIYSYWMGAVCGIYEMLHVGYNKRLPFDFVIPGDNRWPWCQRKLLTLPSRQPPERIMAPSSWNTGNWLFFEMLYASGIGPFSSDTYEDDIQITWLLSENLFSNPIDTEIELSRLTGHMPEQIRMAMSVTQNEVTFHYDRRSNALERNSLKMLFTSLNFGEYLLDTSIYLIEGMWHILRGKAERNLPADVGTLERLNYFTAEYEEFAKIDKPLRQNLWGLTDDMHPVASPREARLQYAQLEKRLKKWRSGDFGIKQGRPLIEPSVEAITFIRKAQPKATDLYKRVKVLRKRNPSADDQAICKALLKTYKGDQVLRGDCLLQIVKAATSQFEVKDTTKLKSRVVSSILAELVHCHLNESIPSVTVRNIIQKSAKNN